MEKILVNEKDYQEALDGSYRAVRYENTLNAIILGTLQPEDFEDEAVNEKADVLRKWAIATLKAEGLEASVHGHPHSIN